MFVLFCIFSPHISPLVQLDVPSPSDSKRERSQFKSLCDVYIPPTHTHTVRLGSIPWCGCYLWRAVNHSPALHTKLAIDTHRHTQTHTVHHLQYQTVRLCLNSEHHFMDCLYETQCMFRLVPAQRSVSTFQTSFSLRQHIWGSHSYQRSRTNQAQTLL